MNRAVLVCPDGGALGSEHFRPVGWEVERRRKQREKAYGGEMQGQPPVAGAGSRRPTAAESPVASAKARTLNLQARIDELERAMIEEALKTAKGNKSLAARMLGVTRNGLAMKVARLFSAEALERSGR